MKKYHLAGREVKGWSGEKEKMACYVDCYVNDEISGNKEKVFK